MWHLWSGHKDFTILFLMYSVHLGVERSKSIKKVEGSQEGGMPRSALRKKQARLTEWGGGGIITLLRAPSHMDGPMMVIIVSTYGQLTTCQDCAELSPCVTPLSRVADSTGFGVIQSAHFIKSLLCARSCSRYWRNSSAKSKSLR